MSETLTANGVINRVAKLKPLGGCNSVLGANRLHPVLRRCSAPCTTNVIKAEIKYIEKGHCLRYLCDEVV